eukprot:CAMPEP_0113239178 /NCGR_PEP_ID=MMETSP0008_2-20120614/5568_1 /TAXON_ID=97485 /ORGANISM="Prymnesium parvum" /LENGTH=95 /DNA_ID=CAMNT_0000086389 /DNA_START=158 /DNA_END=443 /DNA_ORIENTATION=- /assembly_acc=CAM_ASM_000153
MNQVKWAHKKWSHLGEISALQYIAWQRNWPPAALLRRLLAVMHVQLNVTGGITAPQNKQGTSKTELFQRRPLVPVEATTCTSTAVAATRAPASAS